MKRKFQGENDNHPFKKSKGEKKRPSRASFQTAVKKIVNDELRKNTEQKHFDIGLTVPPTNIDWNGGIIHVSNVPQGDTDTTRDGDKITTNYLKIDWVAEKSDSFNCLRVLVVRWKNDTTLTGNFTVPNIFEAAALASVAAPLSQYNWDERPNFEVLKDELCCLTSGDNAISRHWFIDLKKKKISYSAGSTDGIGKLGVVFLADSGTPPDVAVSIRTRLAFVDS